MQERPPVIYGPNGQQARWNGSEYVVEGSAPAGPAMPSIIPMVTPGEQRAAQDQVFQQDDRLYQRGRNAVQDALAQARDERSAATAERQAAAAEKQAHSLTETQAKNLTYGGMMRGAENDYQLARENGYDPASFKNWLANAVDGIPFDNGSIPAWIRDDASDAGYQAERRWVEANLRQLTGAAAQPQEVTRVQGINFDRANDELGPQRYQSRKDSYESTRTGLGASAELLPQDYPTSGAGIAPGDYERTFTDRYDKNGDGVADYQEMTAGGFVWDANEGKYILPPTQNSEAYPAQVAPREEANRALRARSGRSAVTGVRRVG